MIHPSFRPGPLLSCLALSVVGPSVAAQSGPPPGPPTRPIPGITAPDRFPNGCVDCHVLLPEGGLDVRLSTLLAQWRERVEPKLVALAQASSPTGPRLRGRHPEAMDALGDIPSGCLECHGKGARRAPPFAALVHAIHFSGGTDNHFVSVFQGECTHCHKLDPASGRWSMPSAPEPPTRAGAQDKAAGVPPPSSR